MGQKERHIQVRVADEADFSSIIQFRKNLYKGNPYYRDNQTRMIKSLLKRNMEIQKSSEIMPIVVEYENEMIGTAFLGIIDRMNDTLQISFLEMKDDPRIIKEIINYSRTFAKRRGISKLLIGLNFHVNYGLGILASGFEEMQSIGSAYNPKYYIDHIEPWASKVYRLMSYKGMIDDLDLELSEVMQKRLDRFEIRYADFRNIEEVAKIYGQINNQAFSDHEYYYESREDEDIELFNEYKLFLKPENIMFAYKDQKPIAFILWYPDFNQLIKGGQELGLFSFMKSRLFPQSIDTIKLTEFGVIPEYQRTGAIYALLKRCYELNKGRYRYIESGWILEGNTGSRNLTSKFLKEKNTLYKVFEIDL